MIWMPINPPPHPVTSKQWYYVGHYTSLYSRYESFTATWGLDALAIPQQPWKVVNEESKVGSFMLNLLRLNLSTRVLNNILSP